MEFEKDVISRLEFSLSVPLDATDWKTTCELPSVEERQAKIEQRALLSKKTKRRDSMASSASKSIAQH